MDLGNLFPTKYIGQYKPWYLISPNHLRSDLCEIAIWILEREGFPTWNGCKDDFPSTSRIWEDWASLELLCCVPPHISKAISSSGERRARMPLNLAQLRCSVTASQGVSTAASQRVGWLARGSLWADSPCGLWNQTYSFFLENSRQLLPPASCSAKFPELANCPGFLRNWGVWSQAIVFILWATYFLPVPMEGHRECPLRTLEVLRFAGRSYLRLKILKCDQERVHYLLSPKPSIRFL